MAETEQGDGVSNEGESSVDMSSNSPIKRGRGRPQGSKKLKVCVTDVNLMELVSGISNGGSTQPQRGRGRPKHTVQDGSGDVHSDNSVQTHRGKGRPKGSKKEASNEGNPVTDISPKKRGRPKKSVSTPEKVAAEDLPNGGSNTPKMGRGRPKGSTKRKSESLSSGEEDEGRSVKPSRRGRPKGSLNKKPRLEEEVSSEGEAETDGSPPKRESGWLRKVEANTSETLTQDTSNGISNMPRRGRGRPRKSFEQKKKKQKLLTDGSQHGKRGRGRPKGSLNKMRPAFKLVQYGTASRPRRVHVSPPKEKPARPKQPAKRGRPRKYPLPAPEDRKKKPKVWKPLGRPRKYPRVDPPEGAPPAPHRRPGRPRKSDSKRGAHLRKNWPTTPSSPRNPNDGPPRKRGRPPSAAESGDVTPRKRGRPKGSVNKNKASSETQLDSAIPNHSKVKSESSVVEVEFEGEPAEEEVEHDAQTIPTADDTKETLIEQDASLGVGNQA
ncbi:origin recognition complex subunit 4-like [Seriola dumerili]|uniref:origin recognition complex subunit 4-like n=1 Tax=Seriola dumerili TaxID=41447 RepID=UPI000BBEB54D|nr:origin recognition complex subunit 4-like [Seriola dumerili]